MGFTATIKPLKACKRGIFAVKIPWIINREAFVAEGIFHDDDDDEEVKSVKGGGEGGGNLENQTFRTL